MRKVLALFFVLSLALTLLGCGEKTPVQYNKSVQSEALSGTIIKATINSSGQTVTLTDSSGIRSLVDTIESVSFSPAEDGESVMAPGAASVSVKLIKEKEAVEIAFPVWRVGESIYSAEADSITFFNEITYSMI